VLYAPSTCLKTYFAVNCLTQVKLFLLRSCVIFFPLVGLWPAQAEAVPQTNHNCFLQYYSNLHSASETIDNRNIRLPKFCKWLHLILGKTTTGYSETTTLTDTTPC
jgi:hypothetical protein